MIGDSILRGIQQRKFCPQRFVNKQYVPGETREMKQHIEAMVDMNVFDHIIVNCLQSGVPSFTSTKRPC